MPLPDASEAAADAVADIGDELDRAVILHLAAGDPLPSLDAVLDRIAEHVRSALVAAWDETWPMWSRATLRQTVAAIVDYLAPVIRETLDLAALGRRSARRLTIPDELVPEAGSDAGLLALVDRFGLWAALGAWAVWHRRSGRRASLDRARLQAMAARAGEPLPMRLSPRLRMIVRTEVAGSRNLLAADVADGQALALLIRDGRYGPTDEACERVDGKYATSLWVRTHRTEHPNCTRQAIPTRLPAGQYVTLLE